MQTNKLHLSAKTGQKSFLKLFFPQLLSQVSLRAKKLILGILW